MNQPSPPIWVSALRKLSSDESQALTLRILQNAFSDLGIAEQLRTAFAPKPKEAPMLTATYTLSAQEARDIKQCLLEKACDICGAEALAESLIRAFAKVDAATEADAQLVPGDNS